MIAAFCWWFFCWLWVIQILWPFGWIWVGQKFELTSKTPPSRKWMPEQLSGLLIPVLHLGFSDLWTFPSALPHLLSVAYFSWLFRYPVFWFTSLFPTQPVTPSLVTYASLYSTCVTYKTPCHASGHQMLPIQLLARGTEDSPRGDKNFKHVPLLTYLIWFSPKGVYMAGSIYVFIPPLGTFIGFSLVLNQRFKSPICE